MEATAAKHQPAKRGGSVAWAPNRDLDAHEWAAAGQRIGAMGRCIQWLLGDWIAYGNAKFGERYVLAGKITGYDTQTLMNMVYVASHFAVSRRRENLSWSHHETLAALAPDEQDRWLDEAETHRWSVADLRTMLRTARSGGRAAREGGDGEVVASIGEGGGSADPQVTTVTCPRCGEALSLDQLA